jgi:hypothetical protein
MRRADRAEALLDAADHHVADHLAGDAGGGRHPADDFAIMAIEGEGDPHDFAAPAGELQRVRAPGAFERIVATWPSCSRTRRRPVWRSSKRPCIFISR